MGYYRPFLDFHLDFWSMLVITTSLLLLVEACLVSLVVPKVFGGRATPREMMALVAQVGGIGLVLLVGILAMASAAPAGGSWGVIGLSAASLSLCSVMTLMVARRI